MSDSDSGGRDWLLEKGRIVEQPFVSTVPILGPFIVWFRNQWLNVAAKWYVRPLLSQQNAYNELLAQRIRDLEGYVYDVSAGQDRDLTQLQHDLGAVRQQLIELRRRVQALEGQLDTAPTETGQNDGPGDLS